MCNIKQELSTGVQRTPEGLQVAQVEMEGACGGRKVEKHCYKGRSNHVPYT
jgi:hypothetical protein